MQNESDIITEQDQKLKADLKKFLPATVPSSVRLVNENIDSVAYLKDCIGSQLGIIISIAIQDDNKRWIHLSISRRMHNGQFRLPSYEDSVWLKNTFVGDDRKAIMVFPQKEYYVNLMEVLHLFCCLDDDPLPEFSGFREDIGQGQTRTI